MISAKSKFVTEGFVESIADKTYAGSSSVLAA
jgi:hypothetical protein